MKISRNILIESNYFPSAEYIALFLLDHDIIIESQENYQKGSYRNKTAILSANGRLNLSIPLLKGKHQQTPISEVKIAPTGNWNIVHLRAIQSAYGKSPFFDHYQADIEKILLAPTDSLWEITTSSIVFILQAFRISTLLSYSKTYSATISDGLDLRNRYSKITESSSLIQPYEQVFSNKMPFVPHLSALDLLFCHGPYGRKYIEDCAERIGRYLQLA